MLIKEVDDIVTDLNNLLFDQLETKIKNPEEISLSFNSNGYIVIVKYLGVTIWNSEDDGRKYDYDLDDYEETLKSYLIKQVNLINNVIKEIKLEYNLFYLDNVYKGI
jgi:hypothetical protein